MPTARARAPERAWAGQCGRYRLVRDRARPGGAGRLRLGPTAREVAAAAATASKAAAQQASAAPALAKPALKTPRKPTRRQRRARRRAPWPGRRRGYHRLQHHHPGVSVEIGGGSNKSADSAFAPAQRLGGPKVKTAAQGQAAANDAHLDFCAPSTAPPAGNSARSWARKPTLGTRITSTSTWPTAPTAPFASSRGDPDG